MVMHSVNNSRFHMSSTFRTFLGFLNTDFSISINSFDVSDYDHYLDGKYILFFLDLISILIRCLI